MSVPTPHELACVYIRTWEEAPDDSDAIALGLIAVTNAVIEGLAQEAGRDFWTTGSYSSYEITEWLRSRKVGDA